MNADIRKIVVPFAKEHGFAVRKGGFVRIKNDVVQCFCIRERQLYGQRAMNVFFRTYPLCDPEALFYHHFSEFHDITFLKPELAYWPFRFDKDSEESKSKCAQGLIKTLKESLIPYFNTYSYCWAASNDIPEYRGFNNAIHEMVFFNLKTGRKDAAVEGLKGMLAQRERARQSYRQRLGVEYYESRTLEDKPVDDKLRARIEWIQTASDEEIMQTLLQNEAKAREFLKL